MVKLLKIERKTDKERDRQTEKSVKARRREKASAAIDDDNDDDDDDAHTRHISMQL